MGIVSAVIWGVVLVAAALGLLAYVWSVPHWQVLGPAVVRCPQAGNKVALTLDDGPALPFTEQVLDILRARSVPATFFVCGKNVERFPEVVRRAQAEGHTLGNHTYSHPRLWFQSRQAIAREIGRTQELIEEVTGEPPAYFRPPFGVRWFGLYGVLREHGLRLVQWSDTGYDWKTGVRSADVVRETLKRLGPGSIILLHDGRRAYPCDQVDRSHTVEALPAIIDGVRKAGLNFVPLRELLS